MLPSAALGEPASPGSTSRSTARRPDIAGQGVANPLAAILSFEMALRWSLGRPDLADRLDAAVKAALDGGARTPRHRRNRLDKGGDRRGAERAVRYRASPRKRGPRFFSVLGSLAKSRRFRVSNKNAWVPAFAGMSGCEDS